MGAMYEPQNNGPHTLLAAAINDSQTSITVEDATILPAAPNVLTIGTEEDAELVLVESKTGNILTVQRGFNGTTPKAWDAETWIYRAITAQDIQELQKRAGYIVYDLTADELTAMDTAARAALYADGARVLKVTNGETVVLLTLNAEGATQWAGGEIPRNLLDNSDFTNPVNQRGKEVYTGTSTSYTIDRWYSNRATTIVTVGEKLTVDNSDASVSSFVGQKIQGVKDGIYTGGFKCHDGFLLVNTTFSDGAPTNTVYEENETASINVILSGNCPLFQIVVKSEKTAVFEYAFLYEGSYTADTLPPYVPKGYLQELLECQRYYVPLYKYARYRAVRAAADSVTITMPIPVEMRTTPSFSDPASITKLSSMSGASQNGFTFSLSTMCGNSVQFTASKTEHGLDDAFIVFASNDAASAAYLSADL